MKTVILVLLFTSISFSQSPTSQGTINLNGTLSFSTQYSNDINDGRSILSINPQIGYFIIDNLSGGVSLNFNRISVSWNKLTDWSIGPAARYYFPLEQLYPFIGVGFNYFESFNANSDDLIKGNSIVFSLGLDHFLTTNVAIETVLNYSIEATTYPPSTIFYVNRTAKRNLFFIGVGINFFLF